MVLKCNHKKTDLCFALGTRSFVPAGRALVSFSLCNQKASLCGITIEGICQYKKSPAGVSSKYFTFKSSKQPNIRENRFFISVANANEKVWKYVQSGTDFLHWTSDILGNVYLHNETIKFT